MTDKLTTEEVAKAKAKQRKTKNATEKRERTISKNKNSRIRVESTTNANSHPIRFITAERDIINEISDDIFNNDLPLVREVLGSDGVKHINMTKIVRAAVYLLKEHSNAEIIGAIAEAKDNMYQNA